MDFFNNDYKQYLNKGDKILYQTKQNDSYKNFIIPIIAMIMSIFTTLPTFIALIKTHTPIYISIILGVFIFIIQATILNLIYISTNYLITNNGIYKISGILNKKIKYVPYNKITDTSVTIGFIQQFFKIGTINISTAGGTRRDSLSAYEISIYNINNFKKVNDLIISKLKQQ